MQIWDSPFAGPCVAQWRVGRRAVRGREAPLCSGVCPRIAPRCEQSDRDVVVAARDDPRTPRPCPLTQPRNPNRALVDLEGRTPRLFIAPLPGLGPQSVRLCSAT